MSDDARTPDLLDILAHTPEYVWPDLPDGHMYGWRSTNPDLRSRDGFRWAFPGGTTHAPDDGRDLTHNYPDEECPSATLGGLCLAVTWSGARSGGITSATSLLVAFRAGDVLGATINKRRVVRAVTLDVIELRRLNLHRADLRDADLHSADLHSADLRYANLHSAELHSADLHSADLRHANLHSANLHSANLRYANLHSANLHSADLSGADLHGADLRHANLHSAELRHADLHSANLHSAELRYANLRHAELRIANLRHAELWYADLSGADLSGAARQASDPLIPGWTVTAGQLVRSQ